MTNSGIDHEASEQISIAARWLAENWNEAHPIFPTLRQRFGLQLPEAAKALSEANRIKEAVSE